MKIYNTNEGLICLYTISDLAREMGVSHQIVFTRIKGKTLPSPMHLDNKRYYYTEEQFRSVLRAEEERKIKMGRKSSKKN